MSALVQLPDVDSSGPAVNAMTVDVEDYFQVSAFEPHVSRGDWDAKTLRVGNNVDRILDLFDRYDAKATFFVLGWVAERLPHAVRALVERGHEVASHGYDHTRVTQQDSAAFRADAHKTKRLLEDVTGQAVIGYRAASYSIGRDNLWALDVLADIGYRYSSSIYPIEHDLYGMREAPRFACRLGSSNLTEVPVSTVTFGGRNWPCGGGGYFRLLPYPLSRWAIRRINDVDRKPAVFYFHPWEIDPKQPRVERLSLKTRFRHYFNLERMEARLGNLLTDFSWDRMDRVFKQR